MSFHIVLPIGERKMKNVEHCPFCKEVNKFSLGTQTNKDKYLSLISEELNSVPRTWYRCNNCNFVFRSPCITKKESNILYSKYRSYEFRGETPNEYFDRITSYPSDKSSAYAKAKWLKWTHAKTILDVGCGGGILLYQIKKIFLGAILTGIEPNKDYANMVENRLHINVIQQYYRKGLINEQFDLLLCTDVIEHIHNINNFFGAIAENIKEGGYLFLSSPSTKCFDVFSIEHDVFLAPHLYFFESKHLDKLAKKHNLIMINHSRFNFGIYENYFVFKKITDITI